MFRSRATLEAEILILRHQLNIQRRHLPKRLAFSAMDRLIFVGLYRLVPNTIKALTIVRPDTVIRWHRAGFRSYWRWKSRHRCGRPTVLPEVRRLIRYHGPRSNLMRLYDRSNGMLMLLPWPAPGSTGTRCHQSMHPHLPDTVCLSSPNSCRTRRALLHLSYSCASPVLTAMLVTQDPLRKSGGRNCCDAHEASPTAMW